MAKSAAEVMFQDLQKPGLLSGSSMLRENDTYIFPFDSGEARARFESNAGLIDVNAASDVLLASMFDSLGLDEQLRNELVDSILDWRDIDDVPHLYGAEVDDYGQVVLGPGRLPRNAPFQSVDELLLVKHMTPKIYYGHIELDAATNSHRRIPGVRELVTVSSDKGLVDVNQASPDVIAALPAIRRESGATIVSQRAQKPFANLQDLVARMPEFANSETLQYVTTDMGPATRIVSTNRFAKAACSFLWWARRPGPRESEEEVSAQQDESALECSNNKRTWKFPAQGLAVPQRPPERTTEIQPESEFVAPAGRPWLSCGAALESYAC